MLHGRAAAYAIALGAVGTFVLGAWLGSPLVMLAGPVAAAALVLLVAFRMADTRAERDFFAGFSEARGLRYVGRTVLLPMTPLLAAGDRRECTHWMDGPLGEAMPNARCGLGHYTWYDRRRDSDHGSRWVPHHFTICVVDLEPGITLFPGVFLTRRAVLGSSWLSTGTRRKVELESALLHERYRLWVARSQDDVRLRELFSPSFVAWLAEHPLEPCFEYKAGTLVVYLERRLEDAGRLGWLQDAAATIARRLADELEEAGSDLARPVTGAPASASASAQ